MNWFTFLMLSLLTFTMFFAAIMIVVLADQWHSPDPLFCKDSVDVVILNRDTGVVNSQISAVQRFMPWASHIVVVGPKISNHSDNNNIIYIQSEVDVPAENVFCNLIEIHPQAANGFICLGDHTWPVKPVTIPQLFTPDHKARMFGWTDPGDRAAGIDVSTDTGPLPVMVVNPRESYRFRSIEAYILHKAQMEEVVYSPSINRTYHLTEDDVANRQQLARPLESQHLFATCSVSPNVTSVQRVAIQAVFKRFGDAAAAGELPRE